MNQIHDKEKTFANGSNLKRWAKHPESWERLTAKKDPLSIEKQAKEILKDSFNQDVVGRNALFYDTPPNCISDPFRDPADLTFKGLKSKGARFVGSSSKQGIVGNGCFFSKLEPLCLNDPYHDPGEGEREYRRRSKKMFLNDRVAFRPTGPTVSVAGSTSTLAGTESDKQVLQKAQNLSKESQKKTKKTTFRPRNIITAPIRQGGPGFPGVTIGENTEEGRGLFEYKSDPYDAPVKQQKRDPEVSSRRPFSSASHGSRTFSADSDVFASAVGRPQSASVACSSKKDVGGNNFRPFVPSNGVRKGKLDTLNNFPQHMSDPYPETRTGKRLTTNGKLWKPPTILKSRPSSSIMLRRANLQ